MRKVGTLLAVVGLAMAAATGGRAEPEIDGSDITFKLVIKYLEVTPDGNETKTLETNVSNMGSRPVVPFLQQAYPASPDAYKATTAWKVCELVFDYGFRTRMQQSASAARKRRVWLYLYTNDFQMKKNGIWPYAELSDGERKVHLGCDAMGLASKGWLEETLLHELGHVGDRVQCDGGLQYGPDGDHYGDEIVSPYSAFIEGLADYQAVSANVPEPRSQADLDGMSAKIATQATLTIEREGNTEKRKGYTTLAKADLTIWDYAGNETFVAGVLVDIEATGLLDRTGMKDALDRASTFHCRTLADFLYAAIAAQGDYNKAVPALIAILQKRANGLGSRDEAKRLVWGALKPGQGKHDLPRARPPMAPKDIENTVNRIWGVDVAAAPAAPAESGLLGN